MTLKADLHRRGYLLWLLAENAASMNISAVCIRERCNERTHFCSDESDANYDLLPPLPDSVPTYYREIINACLAESPNDRPAARKLLERFPPKTETSPSRAGTPDPKATDFSATGNLLVRSKFCDPCQEWYIQLPFFHCNICATGNDCICRACFDRGAPCHDSRHSLVEMIKIGSMVVPGKYYSNLKSSGKRDVVEL